MVYRIVRCIDKVSLPNIILDRITVPELIQAKLTVKNIIKETENNLYNEKIREKRIKDLSEVKALLSDKYSAQEVVSQILLELDR